MYNLLYYVFRDMSSIVPELSYKRRAFPPHLTSFARKRLLWGAADSPPSHPVNKRCPTLLPKWPNPIELANLRQGNF